MPSRITPPYTSGSSHRQDCAERPAQQEQHQPDDGHHGEDPGQHQQPEPRRTGAASGVAASAARYATIPG